MKKLLFLISTVAILTACDDKNTDKLVTINTSMGDMTVLLYEETPLHKANFLNLAESGDYDSTIFHRVIQGFMIQGGDIHLNRPTQELKDDQIVAEVVDGLFHKKGELAAARQPDNVNPQKKSSGCQFYIVQGRTLNEEVLKTDVKKLNVAMTQLLKLEAYDSLNQQFVALQMEGKFQEMNDLAMQYKEVAEQELSTNLSLDISDEKLTAYTTVGGVPSLDGAYTVFGRVVEGLDVIDKIAAVSTAAGYKPLENIYIVMEVKKMPKSEITEKYGYDYPAEK